MKQTNLFDLEGPESDEDGRDKLFLFSAPMNWTRPMIKTSVGGSALKISLRSRHASSHRMDSNIATLADPRSACCTNELVRAAQAAVDAAAASSSFFGEGATYYVDIRPMHADAIAKFLEGC